MAKYCIALVQLTLAAAISLDTKSEKVNLQKHAAPAPGPSATGPVLKGHHVTFEIENMNYYDLTNEYQDPWADLDKLAQKKKPEKKEPKKKEKKEAPPLTDALDDFMNGKPRDGFNPMAQTADDDLLKGPADAMSDAADDVGDHIEETADDVDEAAEELPMPVNDTASLLQAGTILRTGQLAKAKALKTLGSKMKKTIERSLEGSMDMMHSIMCGGFPVPAPAPAAAAPVFKVEHDKPPAAPLGIVGGASFLSKAQRDAPAPGPAPVPAPAPGPAPGPACAQPPSPKVHVAFAPGKKCQLTLINQRPDGKADCRAVKVTSTIYERPGNAKKDSDAAEALLKQALRAGHLEETLKDALYQVTGVRPKIKKLRVKPAAVPLYDFKACGNHMTALVKQLTVHYSRRQVPMALLNSCTTFLTRMSFSHDYVLDNDDTLNCRSATKKFAQVWEFGKNAESKDFGDMCGNFCEAKYGNDAPQCRREIA